MEWKEVSFMPNRRIIKASDLSGIFIHQDPKRGTIYYDILSRKGYILTSSDVRMYSLYSAMLPLCILAAALSVSLFGLNYLSASILFVALYILAAVAFRYLFFYRLPVANNWKPARSESIFLYFARGYSKQRLVILIILLLLLGILMPLYGRIENYEGTNLIGSDVLGAIALTGSIVVLISLIIKIRNDY